MSFNDESPTDRISPPPLAASALKINKLRALATDTAPLSQTVATLPSRRSTHPAVASLYASTITPPGSRSQSPVGRPASRVATGSVFGGTGNNALALVEGAGDSPGDPLNLILQAFVPHIAVYPSGDTEQLLREKGFEHGLWEMLRPFGERVQGKVIVRDSIGSSRTYEDYAIHFVRFGDNLEHPEPTTGGVKSPTSPNGASEKDEISQGPRKRGAILKDVEDVVERHLTYAEESFFGSAHNGIDTKHGLDIDTPSPYYALYLRRLLSGLRLAPHETFAHPVACVIAISSRNPSPIETLRKLYNDTSVGEKRLPNWVDSEYLRYYVLVHDEDNDDITKSMTLFEQMKRNLGLHCHLLRIRGTQSAASDDDSIPIPRSEWMTASEELVAIRRSDEEEDFEDITRYIFESDATAIRTFIREMVMQSIVPTMERHVNVWNEQVLSKRKGVAGRFLGLTRRWGFGTSSSKSAGSGQSGSNYEPLGFYRADTPEAIMRKLADYAFMLRDWKLAYTAYDLLRSDFNNDKAWRYHAAANEMAALSMLIMPQNISAKTRTEQIDSMFESSFYSYLTRCGTPYGAIRSLALGMELLRLRGGSSVDDAARWGLRLLEAKIAGPIGDALIKERVAVCYGSKTGLGTRHWGARRRKSALWSILGSEAWLQQSKFVQAQRCLNEARRMYGDVNEEQGIDGFGAATAFMLGLGAQLNRQLEAEDLIGFDDAEAGEQGRGRAAGGGLEVDEESEVLSTRGRKASTTGLPPGSLEALPLRGRAAAEEENAETTARKDDFG